MRYEKPVSYATSVLMLQFADASEERPPRSTRQLYESTPVLSFSALSRSVRGRLWLVITCGLIMLVLGVLASGFLSPRFTAVAQIVVDPVDLNLVQNELTPRQSASDAGVLITETQARVIASDSVLRRVAATLRLAEDKEFYKKPFWRNGRALERALLFLGVAAPDADDPSLVALENLRRKILVRRTERTYAIDIIATSGDPRKAALITNSISEAYLLEKLAARSDMARRASAELDSRLEELLNGVHQAEERVFQFKKQHDLITAGGRLPLDQQVAELTSQLSAAKSRTAEAKTRLAQSTTMSLPEIGQSNDVRSLRQELADLKRNEADLLVRFGPANPSVIQVRAQIDSIGQSLANAVDRVGAVNRQEYERDVAAETALSSSLAELKATMTDNEEALVTLHELERDAESRRSVYEAFLHRARETTEQENLDTSNARVITVAVAPRKRSFPPSPSLLLPASLGFGLVFGVALAAFLGPSRNIAGSGRGAREAHKSSETT
jgi:succinoglycan biosynthesis transport protein ExoP